MLPEPDVDLLSRVVREAGAIARTFFDRPCEIWDKKDGSPVTEADLAVNDYLREHLCAARPDYAWLSEESEDDPFRFSASRTFVVDPIDGTRAFVQRLPQFAVSIAVLEVDRPIAAAIYNPMTDECFTAAIREGARLNGAPIRVRARERLDGCRMLASPAALARWAPWPAMYVENPISIAYRAALVAGGAFDAALTMGALHDWDLAAADLIVREAGGHITAIDGSALRYNREDVVQPPVLVAGPRLHAVIRSRLGLRG
jgi:myo-inositol-1(or 4)-monophosphatase